MKRTVCRLRIGVLVFLCLVVLVWGGVSEEKEQGPTVKQNPVVRKHFRDKALSMQPTLLEAKNNLMIDSTTDFMIDAFVKKTMQLAERMLKEADELKNVSDQQLSATSQTAGATTNPELSDSMKKIKQKSGHIKSTAKSLESELDFLIQELSFNANEAKVNLSDGKRDLLPNDIDEIQTLASEFKTKINEFFFSKPGSVSVEELQKSSFPVLLRKIEKYAERVEQTVRRL